MIIDYYDIWLDEADINEINNTSDDIRIEYYPRKTTPMNAVLDELVPDILLFLNSEEVQAIINSTKLLTSFYSIVQKIKDRVKNKEIKKVTAKTCELKEANVIINANNVKILLPVDKTISTTDYLKLALHIPTASIPKDKELIISFENNIFRVEDSETYGNRKTSFETTKAEDDSNDYDKLEQIISNAILKAEGIKEENEREAIKNTKLSKLTIVSIIVLCAVAGLLLLLAVSTIFFYDGVLIDRVKQGFKTALLSLTCGFMAFINYAVNKNKNKSFAFNMLSLLFAFISFVFSLIV